MHKILQTTALSLALATPVMALELPSRPNTFDYDYLDVGLINYDAGGSGLFLVGSHDIYPNINIFGRFAAADHYNELNAGGSYHWAIPTLDNTDALLFGGIERGEFDVGGGSFDDSDTGAFFGAGLRASASRTLELFSNLTYHSFYSGDLVLDLGLRLQLNEKLDLSLTGQLGDNDAFSGGIRYYY